MTFKVDFIGIGVGKSGTTTISRLLETHPEICFSIPKELNQFNRNNSKGRLLKLKNPNFLSKNYSKHFVHCKEGQIKGEFSPSYFIDEFAPASIYNAFPDTKLIVCLRQPVERAYSSFKMVKNYFRTESNSFGNVIKSEPEYVEKGLYFKHLSRFLQYFERSQILVVFFEDIVANPQKNIQNIYKWLEVDDGFIPENIALNANSAKRSRFAFMTAFEVRFVKFVTKRGGARIILWLKRLGVHKLVHSLFTKPYKSKPMSSEDANWLMNQFIEDIKKLEVLLDKNLSHWIKQY